MLGGSIALLLVIGFVALVLFGRWGDSPRSLPVDHGDELFAWSPREGRYLSRAEWRALPWWRRALGWLVWFMLVTRARW